MAESHPVKPPESMHEMDIPPAHGSIVHYNPDAPSEQWGWHGTWREFAPKGSRLLLWIGVAIMFLMIMGNHVSNVENWWLIITGGLLALWLLRGEVELRRERRRRP